MADVKEIEQTKEAPVSDILFIKNKVKDYVHLSDMNASADVIDGGGLNNVIKSILDKAVERAKSNNRRTVMERDL